MFFMGTYTPKIDEKGRLFLPAKFRDRLAEGLVITQGQEKCLVVWPEDVFMQEARRAQSVPMTSRDARAFFFLRNRLLRHTGQSIELAQHADDRMPTAIAGHESRRHTRDAGLNREPFLFQLFLQET